MNQIYGKILNYDAQEISEVKVELYSKSILISDLMIGKYIEPLQSVVSDVYGNYTMSVDEFFEGYVVVPAQTIKNCKMQFNFANVNIKTGQHKYNVVVKVTKYDVHDINLNGEIEIDEIVTWIKDIEENKLKNIDYRVSQFESKLRMLMEIIMPLILKKK